MSVVLTTLGRFLLRHLLSFVLICAVLLAAQWGWAQWHAWKALDTQAQQLAAAHASLAHHIDIQTRASHERMKGAAQWPLAVLTQRLGHIDSQLRRQQAAREALTPVAHLAAGSPQAWLQAQWDAKGQALRLDAEIALLQHERTYLQQARWTLQAREGSRFQRAELERLRAVHAQWFSQWQQVRDERDALLARHPVKCRVPLPSPERTACEALRQQQAALLRANQRAAADYAVQQQRVAEGAAPTEGIKPLVTGTAWEPPQAVLQAITAPLSAQWDAVRTQREGHWLSRWSDPVQNVLPTALWILLGVVLTPMALRAFLYFVVAPLAQRCRPVCLLPRSAGGVQPEIGANTAPGAASAVSRELWLRPGEELLIHPAYLQSTPVAGDKATCWLFNARFALTSLAAGLVALTRIRAPAQPPASASTDGAAATPMALRCVVSATQDAFSEIAVLRLEAGSALVMQPHNLVGVVQTVGAPVHISAHWRLTSLHAWLTLQLRYLAFHGPAQLIVQGCRGVRVESPGEGRSIPQAATVGFSANLAYTTRRSDTFGAYLLGQQGLFNDHFAGSDGRYVYEDTPHAALPGHRKRRGLEGALDGLLKVFGV